MKLRATLIALLSAALVTVTATPAGAILGGERVTYPWAVGFVDPAEPSKPIHEGRLICSGVLLKSQWVLTAAHCLELERDPLSVGDNVIVGRGSVHSGGAVAQVASVVRLDKNRDYCPDLWFDPCDLALVKLNKTVPNADLDLAGESVQPEWGVGSTARVYGYGMEYANAIWSSEHLKRAHTVITAFDADHYRMSARSGLYQSTCRGDSGGPLVVSTSQGPKVVGIVSRGPDCVAGSTTTYTKVGWRGPNNSPAYRWIQTVI